MSVKTVRTDCSHVPTWQVKALLEEHISTLQAAAEKRGEPWSLEQWARSHRLDTGQINRILRMDTPSAGLHVVDLICSALGGPQLLHSLTVIPGRYSKDPIKMATEEYLAQFDSHPPKEFVSR